MELTRKQVIDNLSYIADSMPDDTCGDWRDSLAYAIDIMRKYQKIQEIIKNWKEGTIEEKYSVYSFHDIMGVIEDGNDD